MEKKGIVLILAALLAGSLACDSIPLLAFPPIATAKPTSTVTPTLTLTPTATLSPYPTRTPSPTLIPGIEEPVSVGEATLLITNALRRDAFRCKEDSEPIENPDTEEFLILLMRVVRGPVLAPRQVSGWFRENGIDQMGIRSSTDDFIDPYGRCSIQNNDNMVLTEIHLAFVVDRISKGFILILPDGLEIPLDSFQP